MTLHYDKLMNSMPVFEAQNNSVVDGGGRRGKSKRREENESNVRKGRSTGGVLGGRAILNHDDDVNRLNAIYSAMGRRQEDKLARASEQPQYNNLQLLQESNVTMSKLQEKRIHGLTQEVPFVGFEGSDLSFPSNLNNPSKKAKIEEKKLCTTYQSLFDEVRSFYCGPSQQDSQEKQMSRTLDGCSSITSASNSDDHYSGGGINRATSSVDTSDNESGSDISTDGASSKKSESSSTHSNIGLAIVPSEATARSGPEYLSSQSTSTTSSNKFCNESPRVDFSSYQETVPVQDEHSLLNTSVLPLEQAMALSNKARVLLSIEYPFKILHANAAFLRALGVKSGVCVLNKPFTTIFDREEGTGNIYSPLKFVPHLGERKMIAFKIRCPKRRSVKSLNSSYFGRSCLVMTSYDFEKYGLVAMRQKWNEDDIVKYQKKASYFIFEIESSASDTQDTNYTGNFENEKSNRLLPMCMVG
mmetsp:Transcript_17187/g.22318  ORF Transcript_17187/g.22318 Transcript_17187/m.22318 type:complete len:472 (-) Transcript_17187:143-1558(-)